MTSQKPSSQNPIKSSFEADLNALEKVVAKLETVDIPLEDLIDEFEKGVKLLKTCREYLKNAKSRIDLFVEEKDGQWVLRDFEDK